MFNSFPRLTRFDVRANAWTGAKGMCERFASHG
jgi:hypothetical protein